MLLSLKVMMLNIDYMEKKLEDLEYNDDHIYRTYFEVNPLTSSMREAGFGGNDKYEIYKNSKFENMWPKLTETLRK